MQWNQGHIWKAEIDLDSRIMQDFEFKFVVKFSDNGNDFHVIKWEGGNKNHIFSAEKVRNLLQREDTKHQVAYSKNTNIKIGSFNANGDIQMSSNEKDFEISPNNGKITALRGMLGLNRSQKALMLHQYWVN